MKSMHEEFLDFLKAPGKIPPESLSSVVLSQVKEALDPGVWDVFGKLSRIHVFAGATTLFFCPQFGVGPLGGGHGLMAVFMTLGPMICALACGGFFLGTTALAGVLLLTQEDIRVLKHSGYWQFTLLGMASIGILMLFRTLGPSLTMHSISLEYALFWLLGGALISNGITRLVAGYR